MLTVGSLFAGIGGFDLGLERAGMRSVWQSELDPFCQRVLARHWPDVLRVPDVRHVGADTVPHVDVICGGFPCQDLSYAGRGAGIGGERSGLWSEYARVVGELRPRYVVVENVAALLARGLDVVLGDLAALGYDAEWDCIPASAVGAPHRRDRIWIVAYPDGSRREPGLADLQARQPDLEGRGQDVGNADVERLEGRRLAGSPVDEGNGGRRLSASAGRLGERQGPDVADSPERTDLEGLAQSDQRAVPRGAEGSRHSHPWTTEPDVGRVAHGVPARVDRLRALGNALVPQIAEWIGHRIVEHEQEGRLTHAA